MTDAPRYIELFGAAVANQKVECYRAAIRIKVTAAKGREGLREAIRLREEVIEVLRDAGLSDQEIIEAGASTTKSSWWGIKTTTHSLHVHHPEMKVLAQAMAGVEKLFLRYPERMFSKFRRDFMLDTPTPSFALDPNGGSEAVRSMISELKEKAELLAEETGSELTGAMSIVEIPRNAEPSLDHRWNDSIQGYAMNSRHAGRGRTVNPIDYTAVSSMHRTDRSLYCVRFGIKNAELK